MGARNGRPTHAPARLGIVRGHHVPRLGNVAVSRHAQAAWRLTASLKKYLTKHCLSRHVPMCQMAWISFGASAMACRSSLLRIRAAVPVSRGRRALALRRRQVLISARLAPGEVGVDHRRGLIRGRCWNDLGERPCRKVRCTMTMHSGFFACRIELLQVGDDAIDVLLVRQSWKDHLGVWYLCTRVLKIFLERRPR